MMVHFFPRKWLEAEFASRWSWAMNTFGRDSQPPCRSRLVSRTARGIYPGTTPVLDLSAVKAHCLLFPISCWISLLSATLVIHAPWLDLMAGLVFDHGIIHVWGQKPYFRRRCRQKLYTMSLLLTYLFSRRCGFNPYDCASCRSTDVGQQLVDWQCSSWWRLLWFLNHCWLMVDADGESLDLTNCLMMLNHQSLTIHHQHQPLVVNHHKALVVNQLLLHNGQWFLMLMGGWWLTVTGQTRWCACAPSTGCRAIKGCPSAANKSLFPWEVSGKNKKRPSLCTTVLRQLFLLINASSNHD